MGKFIDIQGRTFGRLTVLRMSDRVGKKGDKYWVCLCKCGKEKDISGVNLRSGRIQSCGCLGHETAMINGYKPKTHGLSGKRLYKIWNNIVQRCYNSNNKAYDNYGGRGIIICQEWKIFINFYEWAMSNGHADNLSIDRIDVNGNYEPTNCRWATDIMQANNRRNNRNIILNGVERTMSEWAKITGIKVGTIKKRIDELGWPIEAALTIQKSHGNRYKLTPNGAVPGRVTPGSMSTSL
jgi:hypothetical protein